MTRDEAIGRIKARFDKWALDDEDMKAIQTLIPELTESEDERMLREIKRYIKEQGDKPTGLPNGTVAVSDMIAWLEKQKETIHISENGMLAWLKKQEEEEGYEAIPVESTLEYKLGFKAGKESEKQKNLTTENIYKHSRERMSFYNGQQKEQKPVHTAKEMWNEMRLEVYAQASGNRHEPNCSDNSTKMFSLYDIDEIFEKIGNTAVGSQPTEWGDEDSDNLERVDNYLWMLDNYVGDDCAMPQGKTDKIRGNIQGILSPWLKNLPKRFSPQPKQEWSEEDERLYKCVLKTLELWAEGKLYQYIIPSNTDRYIDFFKSLKFRVQPQPKQEWSKKDEEILWNIISIVGQSKSIKADEMLDWLKSLRPQYHGDVTMTEAYKMGLEAGKASSWKPSEKQTNNVIVELTRIELGDIINGLYYLKEKYYEDCKEHNGTATMGLSDEFKFYFKRFNEVLDLYTRLHKLEKEKYGTTTDGYYYE